MENLLPAKGFLLVKPLSQNTKGFIVAAGNADTQVDGEVVAVGGEISNEFGVVMTTSLKPGDKIVHRAYGKENYKFEGVDYRFVKFSDCVGIIKDDKK